ncbi:unnamed protein product [Bursaphelenchus okinawaensis]|uniref:Uncharacterized protein n=1 Tax=Bursaphelenchus okinawaensis TaxID=465554 RepID=A0A811L573_9BILA|nr:unnamed protein product [Bursaphelenchus okinawaensis]CAG9117749.1 unnamed protein product [Bursaphelenchus okinawaensis]
MGKQDILKAKFASVSKVEIKSEISENVAEIHNPNLQSSCKAPAKKPKSDVVVADLNPQTPANPPKKKEENDVVVADQNPQTQTNPPPKKKKRRTAICVSKRGKKRKQAEDVDEEKEYLEFVDRLSYNDKMFHYSMRPKFETTEEAEKRIADEFERLFVTAGPVYFGKEEHQYCMLCSAIITKMEDTVLDGKVCIKCYNNAECTYVERTPDFNGKLKDIVDGALFILRSLLKQSEAFNKEGYQLMPVQYVPIVNEHGYVLETDTFPKWYTRDGNMFNDPGACGRCARYRKAAAGLCDICKSRRDTKAESKCFFCNAPVTNIRMTIGEAMCKKCMKIPCKPLTHPQHTSRQILLKVKDKRIDQLKRRARQRKARFRTKPKLTKGTTLKEFEKKVLIRQEQEAERQRVAREERIRQRMAKKGDKYESPLVEIKEEEEIEWSFV